MNIRVSHRPFFHIHPTTIDLTNGTVPGVFPIGIKITPLSGGAGTGKVVAKRKLSLLPALAYKEDSRAFEGRARGGWADKEVLFLIGNKDPSITTASASTTE